jgi:hypothetical protein
MSARTRFLSVCAAAALAVPAAAVAHPGNGPAANPGHGHRHNPTVTYVFKGAVTGAGSVGTPLSVQVDHGNAFVRKGGLVGTSVQFDLTNAKLTVTDTNNDTVVDASDVQAGDKVVVKARLRKSDPGSQPFAARHLVDQTHPPA